jgi:phage tail P2-like protein
LVPSLLPPNSTGLERALEKVGLSLLDIPTPLATLWNPTLIDSKLLAWLAWSLSVSSWKSYWSDTVKRNRVQTAIDIARHQGTAKSVRDVVQAFGGHVEIREWWQMQPKGVPHTFGLVLTLSGDGGTEATAQYVDDVIAEVIRTKPVRSHFSFTQGAQALGGVGLMAVARPVSYARLQLAEAA